MFSRQLLHWQSLESHRKIYMVSFLRLIHCLYTLTSCRVDMVTKICPDIVMMWATLADILIGLVHRDKTKLADQ